MTVYVTMVKDRHVDTEAWLFSTPDKAIAYAKSVVAANQRSAVHVDPDDASMSAEDLARAGWLFYAAYSPEGDCVWVVPTEIDEVDP